MNMSNPDPSLFESMSTPITEARVEEVVAAWSPNTSLSHALALHKRMTEGHLAFAAFAHFGLVAGLVGHRVESRAIFAGSPVRGNLWVMLVGRSASSRKTTSLQLQADIVTDFAPDQFSDRPGTPEAFYRQLAEQPALCLYLPELGDFFAQVQRGRLSSFNEVLVKLFDGKTETIRYVRGQITIQNPRLSLLGGVSPAFLAAHTTPQDWRGGFFSRMLVVAASPERHIDVLEPRDAVSADAEFLLRRCFTRYNAINNGQTPLHSPVGFSPEAEVVWREWSREIRTRSEKWTHHEALHSIFGRASLQTAKLALLARVIRGGGEVEDGLLDAPSVSLAVALVDLHLRSAVECAAIAYESSDSRDKAAILRHLSTAVHPQTLGELCSASGLLLDRAVRILDTLRAQGDVHQLDSGTWTTRRPIPISGAGDLRLFL